MRVGIIGGGISGISLASKLALMKKAGKDIDIVFEFDAMHPTQAFDEEDIQVEEVEETDSSDEE